MGSGAGTPNLKKADASYLAENWDVLTSALEAAANKRTSSTLSSSALSSSALSSSSSLGGGASSSMDDSGCSNRSSRSTHFADEEPYVRRHRASFSSDSEADRLSEEQHFQSPAHAEFAKKRISHYNEYQRLQVCEEGRAGKGLMMTDVSCVCVGMYVCMAGMEKAASR